MGFKKNILIGGICCFLLIQNLFSMDGAKHNHRYDYYDHKHTHRNHNSSKSLKDIQKNTTTLPLIYSKNHRRPHSNPETPKEVKNALLKNQKLINLPKFSIKSKVPSQRDLYTDLYKAVIENDVEKVEQYLRKPDIRPIANLVVQNIYSLNFFDTSKKNNNKSWYVLIIFFTYLNEIINKKFNFSHKKYLWNISERKGYFDILKPLLQAKIFNINEQDKQGNTALHRAVIRGYSDIVYLLIDYGADKNIYNNELKTSCDLAQESKEIVGLIKIKEYTKIIDMFSNNKYVELPLLNHRY